MAFGKVDLSRGSEGTDVIELQLRLAGFRGTVWDGDFGPGTELQVITFQRDYMGMKNPTGRIENEMFKATDRFARDFPIDFKRLRCSCGQCGGFGRGLYKDEYRDGKPRDERYHKYEYPGIHKAILHALRGARFYSQKTGYDLSLITSGYRCWIDNKTNKRTSTNHMGKAIDCDIPNPGNDKKDDIDHCNAARGVLVEKCNFQIGWSARRRKALEPSNIAPSWVHMDTRCYTPEYLLDRYFVKSSEDLDKA